jgi:enoyl-[acyl-carrier protein] reductase III
MSTSPRTAIDLTGKTAFVTGGSGDIGRAICIALAAAGARIAFTYLFDRAGAAATAEAVAAAYPAGEEQPQPVRIRCNLADENSTAAALEQLRAEFDRVDIFVSNAASGVLRPFAELEQRHLQWTLDVNARGFFTVAQELIRDPGDGNGPLMGHGDRGGRIVTLSSQGATRAIPMYTAIGASKAALEALTRHLALDLGPSGITVNAVSPGIVDTKALRNFPNREQLLDVAARRTPLGRLTEPEDVAALVLFLCSDGAAMIHGQTIQVDGGYSVMG